MSHVQRIVSRRRRRATRAVRTTRSSRRRVHQELLNRLNLERLTRRSRGARPSRRSASLIIGMLEARGADARRSACSSARALIIDVLNELFGLGPLEALLQGPDHLRHPRQPPRPGVHRARTASSRRPTSSSRTTGT